MTSALFRVLMRLYPRRFRAAYGADMTSLFEGRARRARAAGRLAFARVVVHAYADLVAGAIAERTARRAPERGAGAIVSTFARDLRIAARTLVRQPMFFATVVLTLGIAIGATTAIASLVDATLVRPLPYPQADRLVALVQEDARFGKVPFAPPFLRDFRERLASYDQIAAFTASWQVTITGAGDAQSAPASFVSDGLLEMFGARPLAGRLLSAADEKAAAPVALVSERLWARTFGSATPLAGQTLRVDDQTVTIVGILPDSFRMPITSSIAVATHESAELWLPLARNPLAALRTIPVANTVGRLKPGISVDHSDAELRALAAPLATAYREVPKDARFAAVSLATLVSEPVRRPLTALLVGVLVLLLIACANVANLVLAKAASRSGDLAVRAALGASRARLIQQTLAESVLLAGAGAIAGLVIANLALSAIPSLALGDLPPSARVGMDLRAVTIAAAAGGLVAMLIALLPAIQATRGAMFATIRDGARTVEGGVRGLRGSLVLIEVALALVLLVSAGLLARSFLLLSRVDPGFRAEGMLANTVAMPGSRYPTPESRRAFLARVADGLAAVPGVQAVAAVNRLPLGGANVMVGVEIEGQPQPEGPVSMDRRVVAGPYFEAIGIPLLAGRHFNSGDAAGSSDPVVIVNDAIASRFWAGRNPIGGRLRLMLRGGPGPWLRIVGVAGNVRHHGLDRAAQPEVYVPYSQAAVESMVFLVRAAEPSVVAAGVRDAVRAIDPLLPVRQEMPVDLLHKSVAEPRLRAMLFNGFAAAALLLAALGIYGVVSAAVARRTREIGVRVALGATRGSIVGLVMRSGLRTVLLGAAVGLAGAALAGRALRGLLFGIPPLDPVTYLSVTGLLIGVAVAAILLPARRAMRLDPIQALRTD